MDHRVRALAHHSVGGNRHARQGRVRAEAGDMEIVAPSWGVSRGKRLHHRYSGTCVQRDPH